MLAVLLAAPYAANRRFACTHANAQDHRINVKPALRSTGIGPIGPSSNIQRLTVLGLAPTLAANIVTVNSGSSGF